MKNVHLLCFCSFLLPAVSIAENTKSDASEAATDQAVLEQLKPKIEALGDAIEKASKATDKDAALKDVDTAYKTLKDTNQDLTNRSQALTPLLQNFSAGLAVIFISGEEHVEKYSVRGQTVTDENGQTISIGKTHVDSDKSNIVMPWLETHYIWDGAWNNCKRGTFEWHDLYSYCTSYIKPGFFVGVALNPTTSALDTFGIGFLLASKRTAWSNKSDGNSINVGVGWYTTQITVLAKDTPEGSDLPQGYTSPATREKTVTGPMLNISFSI